jgi:hypothetical protein
MKSIRVSLAILVLLATCAAWAQKVDVDWDRDADFSKFKTYAWTDSKHPAQGLWAQRVMDSVNAKLTAAGLTKVDPSAHPDLEVVYNAGIKEHTVVEDYDYGYRGWWGWWGPRPPSYTTSFVEKQATLVVDLVDNSNKQMVWRAVARDTLADSSDKNLKTFSKAMDKMFKSFPPKKK